MEKVLDILNSLGAYINVLYLFSFMLLGYLIKKNFQGLLLKIFKKEIKMVYVMLILATLLAIPYYLTGSAWQQLIFAYALGTSLHELIFYAIDSHIEKLKNKWAEWTKPKTT